MTPPAIDTVVFDLGKVLIDFEYGNLLSFLVNHGVPIDSKTYLLEHIDLYAYERGEIVKVAEYNAQDVRATIDVYRRVRDSVLRFREDW